MASRGTVLRDETALPENTAMNLSGFRERYPIEAFKDIPGALNVIGIDDETAEQWRLARAENLAHSRGAYEPLPENVEMAQPFIEVAEAVPYYGAPPPSQFRAQAYAVTDEDVKDLQQAPSYWLDDDNAPITAEAWAVFGKMVKRGLRILKSHHKKGKESKKCLIKQLKSQKMPKNRFGLRKFYIKYVESL
jgi:hypothetical protein